MSEELIPCPFCGSEATFAKTSKGWKVECIARMGSCHMNARTHYQPQKYLAVNAWNTRADLARTQVAAVYEAAAKVAEECPSDHTAQDVAEEIRALAQEDE